MVFLSAALGGSALKAMSFEMLAGLAARSKDGAPGLDAAVDGPANGMTGGKSGTVGPSDGVIGAKSGAEGTDGVLLKSEGRGAAWGGPPV